MNRQERDRAIAEDLRAGLKYKDISERHNVSITKVFTVAKEEGLTRSAVLTYRDKAEMVELYHSGLFTLKEISEKFDCAVTTVWKTVQHIEKVLEKKETKIVNLVTELSELVTSEEDVDLILDLFSDLVDTEHHTEEEEEDATMLIKAPDVSGRGEEETVYKRVTLVNLITE